MDNNKPEEQYQSIRTSEFDYELPDEQIARYPAEVRDQARMLMYQKGTIRHSRFLNLPEELPPHCVLLFNDTKVVPARLVFYKSTGARIEIFCLEPQESDPAAIFNKKGEITWNCMVGNLRKWKQDQQLFAELKNPDIHLKVTFLAKEEDHCTLKFQWEPESYTWAEILEHFGETPLPPYLKRAETSEDKDRYQTVFAQNKGAVAAPTATLHFTRRLTDKLRDKGIKSGNITLHTGMGTFKPVSDENPYAHPIHEEMVLAGEETLHFLKAHAGNIIMGGTTTLRAAESVYWAGVYLLEYGELPPQGKLQPDFVWQQHGKGLPPGDEVFDALINHLRETEQDQLLINTRLFILPGYSFPLTSGLITNFHQPRSTLLMLIAAFIGNDWKKVYQEALDNDYRFLSYGDGSLLMR